MPQYHIYFDTVEGEKKYDVDIGDEEAIDQVIREIIGELTERGHMMKGLATGDLKVVWGEGQELDQSRTLPEQGVRPDDVLRVLVETYEGGAQSLRRDRIETEWTLLRRLAAANPEMLELGDRRSEAIEEQFRIRLLHSPGLAAAGRDSVEKRDTHTVRLTFPRFFPDMPIECHVMEPLFHPNVKPATGFVCLWEQAQKRDTVVQAIARVQAIAAYRMVNMGDTHVMNRPAGDWYRQVGQSSGLLPLSWDEVRVFEVKQGRAVWFESARPGQRTSR